VPPARHPVDRGQPLSRRHDALLTGAARCCNFASMGGWPPADAAHGNVQHSPARLDTANRSKAPGTRLGSIDVRAAPPPVLCELSQALIGRQVTFILIKDSDRRLSRPQDLARLIAAAERWSRLGGDV
jgi:hypothetical protein